MITLDDFKKIEMKTARVLEVKDHPGADRLYVMSVDLGGETRQLVAGIKNCYQPQDLCGRTVVVLSNLEPVVIRGVKSEGMVLAASGKDSVAVLTTLGCVEEGSPVK